MEGIRDKKNFKQSIEDVYGVSWEQMKRDMQNYINLVIAQTPKK